nr:MAG TPA: hypothetical protein [Caudoviricetes sp.]
MHTGGIIVHYRKSVCRAFAAVRALRRRYFDNHGNDRNRKQSNAFRYGGWF